MLDAAAHLLGEVGIERISTNLICERAEVTPPAFYRYFDDKYAILHALAERFMERQNVALQAWLDAYGGAGIDVIEGKVVELIRTMHEITKNEPGAVWIMRALRAVPNLTPIRHFSHNYVSQMMTDIYMQYLSHVPRDLVLRRTRISVEIAYSLDEMLKEGEMDPEALFADAEHVFRAMFHYPEYALPAEPAASA
ncbi:TetR/AcrR family transcriptional regulator [Novosphingobium guangzhouense]|uniref:TetR/AcrR family transcriptional regulator n=1 Tax=Novosphingobium guangzhouense TaxID=1850347 RepID=UPI001FE7AFC6|nr:TetR/AcrR family transcriptional regulator [Novosphingobium guangzhouense]